MIDLKNKYLTAILAAGDEATLEDIRLQAVGKKGEVALKMRELGKMSPEERQVMGPKLNALKDEINRLIWVAINKIDEYFLTYAREEKCAPLFAGPVLCNSDPT